MYFPIQIPSIPIKHLALIASIINACHKFLPLCSSTSGPKPYKVCQPSLRLRGGQWETLQPADGQPVPLPSLHGDQYCDPARASRTPTMLQPEQIDSTPEDTPHHPSSLLPAAPAPARRYLAVFGFPGAIKLQLHWLAPPPLTSWGPPIQPRCPADWMGGARPRAAPTRSSHPRSRMLLLFILRLLSLRLHLLLLLLLLLDLPLLFLQ